MAKGKIVQIIGTVLDVEFPAGYLPNLFDALVINAPQGRILLEVQDHIGNNWVRCLSLSPTEGLARGMEVEDTGAPISVPVGRACLGRLFDVTGTAIDNLGEVKATAYWPIHRPAATGCLRLRPSFLSSSGSWAVCGFSRLSTGSSGPSQAGRPRSWTTSSIASAPSLQSL